MPDLPPEAMDDCYHPPSIPTEVHCLHCGCEYESYLIEWREQPCHDGSTRGFWCCPTPRCTGAGFGFDIHPTDPNYNDPDGREMPEWTSDECTGEDDCDCVECMIERGEIDPEDAEFAGADDDNELVTIGCGEEDECACPIPLDDLLPSSDSEDDPPLTFEIMMEIEEKLGLRPPREPENARRAAPPPPGQPGQRPPEWDDEDIPY
jgi:hypothetical protein